MPNDNSSYSRMNRFEKKRKNTKWLTMFIGLGLILIVVFIIILATSGDDLVDDPPTQEKQEEPVDSPNKPDQEEPQSDPDQNTPESDEDEDSEEPDQSDSDHINIQYLEIGDDHNVMYAYTGNWDPIPTEQAEPHQISWDQSSQDWREMMQAAEMASGIAVDEMYYLWVSGEGPQSVIATFSNNTMDQHYRVYLSWIENQGWLPDRVEMLHEHDQMFRFNN
ncbi:YrrS family protein [Amphibacillus sediminis]|uniref:YrrS family protein n=1 Tax=Amphibacillus sediminis TaxID=360185 RepID=UPI00082B093B|nr:YrrS family protein [Amphibacillus sediminis]